MLLHALHIGHGGYPPVAEVLNPVGTASTSSSGYVIRWLDTNQPIVTGTATVDIYYAENNPPTYRLGTVPPTLTGTAIATGIRETDTTDELLWDLTNVPTGTYWIWSIVHEPPNELGFQQIFYFSPGTLTVVHPGDEAPPSIYLKAPDTPFRFADTKFEVEYIARDPHGTGKVKLEATLAQDGTGFQTIAEDLPAVTNGRFVWDTSNLERGDWTVRATISDARGMSRSVYARYFLLIEHFPDGGVADGGLVVEEDGCSCATSRRAKDQSGLWLVLSLLALLRANGASGSRRRGSSAAK
jgi:hypothetical protein